VGHPDYTRENGSYGALTLRRQHVQVEDGCIRLAFRAKGGKRVRRRINDRKLARVLDKISDLPGAELLTWVDDAGETHALSSSTLNAYLSDAAGIDGATAKTFRTWIGTRAAFEVGERGEATIKAMSEAAAAQLNNTATIARNSYIHPAVVDLAGADPLSREGYDRSDLYASEGRLLRFLERH
jgi:DNA topoisomerase-1